MCENSPVLNDFSLLLGQAANQLIHRTVLIEEVGLEKRVTHGHGGGLDEILRITVKFSRHHRMPHSHRRSGKFVDESCKNEQF